MSRDVIDDVIIQSTTGHFLLVGNWYQVSITNRFRDIIMEIGEAIKNPAYRIFQTEYSGCLDISAHA